MTSGPHFVFNVEEVSLLDINKLIDMDRRFDLKPVDSGLELDDLEEYYESRVTVSERG